MARKLNYPGVVLGILNADGTIDTERTKRLVDLASPMEVTFHRAFDRCKNPLLALEEVIKTGCKRILTSGQVPNAADNLPLIKKLVAQAGNRIIIMPGSGVRSHNMKEIMSETGATEIHSSARKMIPSQMQYFKSTMQEELLTTGVDASEIKKMLELLKN
jgi:copper homeostasis protein